MEQFNEQLVARIDDYIEGLFCAPADPVLAANIANANAAGLPAINVTANQGKFLTCWPESPGRGGFRRSAPWAVTALPGWGAR